FDVEIFGSRWNQLQLGTVAEDHAQGRHLLRCRLLVRWSLQSKVMFWGLAGLELLVLGLFSAWSHWIYLLLLLLPVFAWFLHRQGRNLQSMIVVFLDQLARELNLTRLQPHPDAQPIHPAGTMPSAPALPPDRPLANPQAQNLNSPPRSDA